MVYISLAYELDVQGPKLKPQHDATNLIIIPGDYISQDIRVRLAWS